MFQKPWPLKYLLHSILIILLIYHKVVTQAKSKASIESKRIGPKSRFFACILHLVPTSLIQAEASIRRVVEIKVLFLNAIGSKICSYRTQDPERYKHKRCNGSIPVTTVLLQTARSVNQQNRNLRGNVRTRNYIQGRLITSLCCVVTNCLFPKPRWYTVAIYSVLESPITYNRKLEMPHSFYRLRLFNSDDL